VFRALCFNLLGVEIAEPCAVGEMRAVVESTECDLALDHFEERPGTPPVFLGVGQAGEQYYTTCSYPGR